MKSLSNVILVDDKISRHHTLSAVVPLCSEYKDASNEPSFSLLAPVSTKSAYLSMLHVHQMASCSTACSAGWLKDTHIPNLAQEMHLVGNYPDPSLGEVFAVIFFLSMTGKYYYTDLFRNDGPHQHAGPHSEII